MKSAMECFDELVTLLQSRKPALFLDYDGTLTPIVQDPADAFLPERAKRLLNEAKRRFPVGIISGRDLDDLMGRVGIEGIAYAGSHGLEIVFINGERKQLVDELDKCLCELEAAEIELRRLTKSFRGAIVERKRFGVALHYRAVAADQISDLVKLFEEIASRHPYLKRSEGKRVVELSGTGADKGTAISEIMKHEGITDETHLPIFIGDDLTDEDGFKTLKGRGIGVIVGYEPKLTEAEYYLSNQEEVLEFLEKLVNSVQGND
ncbi:MAG: trehalose-phosphatase [Candidatus Methanosuratincola petrocarbonis]